MYVIVWRTVICILNKYFSFFKVLLLNGKQTEGIFRVSADVDEVGCMKNRLDRWDVPDYKNTLGKYYVFIRTTEWNVNILPNFIVDAHTPASLLKLWYRELYDPLIPDAYYEDCVNTEDPDKAKEIVNKLPEINQLVSHKFLAKLKELWN